MDNTPPKQHLIPADNQINGIILIRQRIRQILHNQGYNLGDDFFKGFNVEVRLLLDKAINRARQNGRKRIMLKDI